MTAISEILTYNQKCWPTKFYYNRSTGLGYRAPNIDRRYTEISPKARLFLESDTLKTDMSAEKNMDINLLTNHKTFSVLRMCEKVIILENYSIVYFDIGPTSFCSISQSNYFNTKVELINTKIINRVNC